MFESLVNTEGIQTVDKLQSIAVRLRVLLIRKEFKRRELWATERLSLRVLLIRKEFKLLFLE